MASETRLDWVNLSLPATHKTQGKHRTSHHTEMSSISVGVESLVRYAREHVFLNCFAVFALYSVVSWSWNQWTLVTREIVEVING